jgi:hypothetical protein
MFSERALQAVVLLRRLVARFSPQRARFDPRSDFWCTSGTVAGFSPSTSVLPCQYYSTNAPCSSSSTCRSYQRDKWGKPGNLPKKMLFRKSGCIGWKSIFNLLESAPRLIDRIIQYTDQHLVVSPRRDWMPRRLADWLTDRPSVVTWLVFDFDLRGFWKDKHHHASQQIALTCSKENQVFRHILPQCFS